MQLLVVIVSGIALVLFGIYAFPIPKASFRVIYSKVPEPIARALNSFRRDYPPIAVRIGPAVWRYHDTGVGENVIVFLHGLASSGDIWFQQIEALQDRFRCLALTYPALPNLDLLRFGVLAVLDRAGISRVNLVGSSMGGYLAQYLTAREPERIRKLVLGNTFSPNGIIRKKAQMGVKYLPWVPEWAIMAGMRRNTERILHPAGANSDLVRAYLYEQTCGIMRKPDLIARCACLCQTFTPPDLIKLGIPTLIIETDNDPLVDSELRNMLKAAYPSAAVKTFYHAGHFPYLNHSEVYTQALVEFLS
jgi:pimeloyl-ACP methyl ester carboxylesterase